MTDYGPIKERQQRKIDACRAKVARTWQAWNDAMEELLQERIALNDILRRETAEQIQSAKNA